MPDCTTDEWDPAGEAEAAHNEPPADKVREHNLESADCWCAPLVEQPCPSCDGEGECWRCGGEGWVPEYDADAPRVIVHNEGVPDAS